MKKLFISFLLSILTIAKILSQPLWVPTTPSVAAAGPLSIYTTYGIDRAGTVYITVINSDISPIPTSEQIKADALAGPSGTRTATAVLPIPAGSVNLILNTVLNVLESNKVHSVFLVAEDVTKVLQMTPIKLLCTPLTCPDIYFLNGWLQTIKCVNKVATVIFNTSSNFSNGILAGTSWIIDWGDGTTESYISVADNDFPPLSMRTHTYTYISDCNYIFTCSSKNPCGKWMNVQYVAVAHGRDGPYDGDGFLQIVNNVDGSTLINVCEGTESKIIIRDNSIWNCQNPVVPVGLTADPNLDPRNIEWLYGRNPVGEIKNTITGAVAVAGLGFAPQSSGRISPSPYGPSSLAQEVTIPNTCKAGEYFRVYLKNWNKCNWTDPEYIYTYLDIQVVAAPSPPVGPNKTICYGGNSTLSIVSTPIGSIHWYAGATLTTLLGVGITYTPTITEPGEYHFYVTDQSLSGAQCMSTASSVTLNILPVIGNNTIGVNQTICYNETPSLLIGSDPTGGDGTYIYQWQSSPDYSIWTNIKEAITQTYSPPSLIANTYYRRLVTSGPCTMISNSVLVTVDNFDPGTIYADQSICEGASPSAFTVTPAGGTYQWKYSLDGITFTNLPGATSVTYAAGPLMEDTWYKRLVTSANNCTKETNSTKITINEIPPLPTITKEGDILISSSSSGNQWFLDGSPVSGATGQSHTAVITGNYYVIVTQYGCSSASSNIINVSTLTSIENLSSVRVFDVFTNPNWSKVFIRIELFQKEEYALEIINNAGTIIWKKENVLVDGTYRTEIDLRDYKSAIYLVVLSNKTDRIVKKFVVAR